jgi:hypothetical protein
MKGCRMSMTVVIHPIMKALSQALIFLGFSGVDMQQLAPVPENFSTHII